MKHKVQLFVVLVRYLMRLSYRTYDDAKKTALVRNPTATVIRVIS